MEPASALAGLRVLDLSNELGWYCGKLLADLGADVLRLESPDQLGPRQRSPFADGAPHHDRGIPFWYFNTSKRSELCDLESVAGQDRFRELVQSADIVIETAEPGYFRKRGIAYESVSAANPGLIWAAITPFGQTGPYALWPATDLTLQAISGLMFLAGMPGSPPSQLGGNQAEYLAGIVGATGITIAAYERQTSGRGQYLDISAQEAVSLDGENALPYWDFEHWVRPRLGDKNYRGLRQLFRAKDGWVILSLGNRWKPFREWLAKAGITSGDWQDPKWESSEYRTAHTEELEAVCKLLCERQTRDEIYKAGQEARVGVGPILHVDEQFLDPQLAVRDFWRAVFHPELGREVTYPGPPYRLSVTPWRIHRRPPLLGEHTGEGWLPRDKPVSSASAADATVRPASYRRLPLAGLRVIDMSWVAAGPMATRVLAEHGAEVIKVETNVHPDSSRLLPTARPRGNNSPNVSGMWNNLNTSKRSIALDLRDPDAMKILEQLISIADVLVDNYGVDPYPKWGLTPERLRELSPDLIVARSSVMGRSGPRQHYIGFGYTIGAAAGHNSITGFPGDPPTGACIAHPDYTCNPFHLAVAVLSALRYRSQTGIGQTIDLSQHESTLCWIGPELMDYAYNENIAGMPANRNANMAPHGAYACAGDDKWIAISCRNDDEFRRLAALIGGEAGHQLAGWATLADRKTHEDELDRIIAGWTAPQDSFELMRRLQGVGVTAAAVVSHRDLIEDDPQMAARGHYRLIEHPEGGLRIADGTVTGLANTPGFLRRPAPLLGEDSESVYGQLLGLSDEALTDGYVKGWIN